MTIPDVFDVSLHDDGKGRARLVLRGELDLATAPQLGERVVAVCADKPAELLLDLTDLSYCDSSGLREFVRAARLCDDGGSKLTIIHANEIIRRLFELTGVAEMLT